MIRSLFMLTALSSCSLQQTTSPLGPEPKQCLSLQTALTATRDALDEDRFRLFGRVLREVMIDGDLGDELIGQLSDPAALMTQLEGHHLRSLVEGWIQLMADGLPVRSLELLRVLLAEEQSLPDVLAFMDAQPGRWQVLTPLREMLTSCRDGGDLADLMTRLPLMEGSCGRPELLCALDDLVIVMKSPDLKEAVSSIDFEGRLGRAGFQQLVIHLMDVTATPGFDTEALKQQVRRLFDGQLDESTLVALEGLVASWGRLMGDSEVQQPWSRVVACVKRYDSNLSVSGLSYDLLTDERVEMGTIAGRFSQVTEAIDGRQVFAEWSRLASMAAGDPALRERLSFGLRPLLVPTLAELLSPRVVELQARGVLREWVRLVEEGLPCED